MNPRPTYQEYLPSPVLRPYVACYWTFGCTGEQSAGRLHRVIPDACMDVLFSLGENPGDALPGEVGTATRVVGTMTRSLEFEQSGPMDLLGVRFRPGGAIPFVDVPASEVTDDHTASTSFASGSKRCRGGDTNRAPSQAPLAGRPWPGAPLDGLGGLLLQCLLTVGPWADRVLSRVAEGLAL